MTEQRAHISDDATAPSGVVIPPPLRGALIGAVAAGVAGGVVGLVVGFRVRPATAGFAAFEIGVPAAFMGVWIGLVIGGVVSLVRDGRRGPDDESSRAFRRRDTGIAVVIIFGAGAVVSALRWMSWARRTDAIGTATFRNGPVPLLVIAALLSVVLALVITLAHRRWLRLLLVTATLFTAGAAITVALARIAAANTSATTGATTTSYEPGTAVAVLAAFAMVIAATFGLLTSYQRRPGPRAPT